MENVTDLTGKTIVVTGATAGIGQAALTALAARGATVIGVGRSEARCEAARRVLLSAYPQAQITYLVADLASQRQVRLLATAIRERLHAAGADHLDVLVNNAGTVSSWYVATEDGYEMQFAVNHLAAFLLTGELLPLLGRAEAGRVLTVSSGSHFRTRIHWQDVMFRRGYGILKAYTQSKLANVLFSAEFNRRMVGLARIRAYAVDPGLVNTQIGLKGTSGLEHWFWGRRAAGGVSPEQAAQTIIHLASAPTLEDPDAVYWNACRPCRPSRIAQRPAEAARLWALSERLCGIIMPEGQLA
ncbi:MAG: SDR family NAD(P)-dependent oxidoreductase [Anaerolineae bacterium]|nr:SDR family NAD(P)-dependent oxidoreductase [Anaerolineae bacterium]